MSVTEQQPGSRSRWTGENVPVQAGRTAVVTGANSGIGLEAASVLAERGARVVLACRDPGRALDALARIGAAAPRADVGFVRLDLASLTSIREAAGELRSGYGPIDLLINNAGVMMTPYGVTTDGFELQLGVNHLGHFALTGLLLPALLASGNGPRVVTVSSGEHHKGSIDFDDLMIEHSYGTMRTYQRTKLANLLLMFELQRRADAAGVPLLSVAAHPGFAATNLGHDGNPLMALGVRLAQVFAAQPAAMGALPTLYAATAADVRGGEYFGPDGRGEMRGYPTRVNTSTAAHDSVAAQRLWAVSEELTGVRYEALAGT